MRADLMRDGLSLDDLGKNFSWIDLKAYIKYRKPDSAVELVVQNPPVDPSTVPTSDDLAGVSNRLAEKRRQLAGRKSKASSLSEKQVKKQVKN